MHYSAGKGGSLGAGTDLVNVCPCHQTAINHYQSNSVVSCDSIMGYQPIP